MQAVTIKNNQAGQRLDKFLHKFMPEAGKGFLYKMLRKKNITLNGKRAEGSEILVLGDTVSFFFSPETFVKMTGTSLPKCTADGDVTERNPEKDAAAKYTLAYHTLSDSGIAILYEDNNILIADKPAGVLSQKAAESDISLNEWLIGYLLEKECFSVDELRTFKPSVCNRLDRNTSGIVLCGKSLAGSQYLSRNIKEKHIRKLYRTICVGEITRETILRGYLKKDSAKNKVTVSRTPDATGGTGFIQNYIETVCRPLAVSGGYTLLEVNLITGKTHQIRAHLADIGHPLIGDAKYGDSRTNRLMRERYDLQYQLLHAYMTELPAEDTEGGAKVICAPYPKVFLDIMEDLHLC